MTKQLKPVNILIFVILSSALVLSCSALGAKKENLQKLNRSLFAYNHSIQTKDLEVGADYVDPKKNADYYDTVNKAVEEIEITDFRIRKVTMNAEKNEAEVVIIRNCNDLSSYVVKKKTINQTWKLVGGAWILTDGDF